jgi:hypothetical protein
VKTKTRKVWTWLLLVGAVLSVPAARQSEESVKTKTRKVWAWLLVGVVLVASFGFLVYLSFPDVLAALSNSATRVTCSSVPTPSSGREVGSAGPTVGKVTAKLQPGQEEEVDFGRSMTSRILILYFNLSTAASGPPYFHTMTGAFVRADDASLSLAHNEVVSAMSDGSTLILYVCFNRSTNPKAYLGDPGSYTGSVTIDDSRLSAPVTVPITVTMQYPNGVFLLWLYFGAIIPGAWCLWVIKGKRDGDLPALGLLAFLKWVFSVDGLIAVVTGSVAAFAVYVAVYLRDPTWGSSALQPLTLYGGMFSAFVTTANIASLTGNRSKLSLSAPLLVGRLYRRLQMLLDV